jgi:hypothetical protein
VQLARRKYGPENKSLPKQMHGKTHTSSNQCQGSLALVTAIHQPSTYNFVHGPKPAAASLRLRLGWLALATRPIGRSPALHILASATQNNLNAPARLSLSFIHLIATFSVASPGKRA